MKTVFALAFVLASSPASAQIPNYQEQVQRAIDSFTPRLSCPSPCSEQDDDTMKGRVLLRAAYFINQIDPSIGLLQKGGGSSIKGFSADVLIQRGTGHWADVLTTTCCDGAGGRYPVAQWDATVSSPTDPSWAEWVARWRQPTAELAELGTQPPPPTNPPPTQPPQSSGDHDAIIALMGELQQKQTELAQQQTALRQYIEQEAAKLHAEHQAAGGAIEQLPGKGNTATNITKWAAAIGAILAPIIAGMNNK